MSYIVFCARFLISLNLIFDGIFQCQQPIKSVQYMVHHHSGIWLESKQFFIENFSEQNNPFAGEQNFQFFVIYIIQGLGFFQIILATCIVFGCRWANQCQICITLIKSYNNIFQVNFIELSTLMGRIGSLMI